MADLDRYKPDSKPSLPCVSKAKRNIVSRRSSKKEDSVFDAASLVTLGDKKLEKMTIKELNEFTREIPKQKAKELKKRRRILKNRRYALKCRLKSKQKSVNMADENVSLEKELSATKSELKTIINERDYYKSKYCQLYSCFFHNISGSTSTRASKLAD